MDQYIDIRILPDPEFTSTILMGALYGKLHRALVKLQSDDIGISFPEHQRRPKSLGGVLRLHGSATALDHLMSQDCLAGMRDHIQMTGLAPVPGNAKHRVVRRRQFKTNAERLRRRRARRHEETLEQAREQIPDTVERKVDLPYVTLRSQSTGQDFCLFIEHGDLQAHPVTGRFSRYGLSPTATIPWF